MHSLAWHSSPTKTALAFFFIFLPLLRRYVHGTRHFEQHIHTVMGHDPVTKLKIVKGFPAMFLWDTI